ncbi:hypothetical protein VPKG_00008 [Vibrio phage pYD21-A]|uniref:hypothetical protein n=1 Tax=Vibrio phage pYD21-A TaxID=754049 RepID=UPI0002C04F7C|nr:hypothetical protein VPKG_00008 [Vibrio phage pYD21-A]AGH16045.1 hypothetical protein VPKG_00008 [Vibrio phage pYD21-A]
MLLWKKCKVVVDTIDELDHAALRLGNKFNYLKAKRDLNNSVRVVDSFIERMVKTK